MAAGKAGRARYALWSIQGVEPLIFSVSAMDVHGLGENSKPPAPNRRPYCLLVACSQCQRTNGVTFNPVDNVSTTNMNVLDRVA